MSSALWFQRAKAALALVEWLDSTDPGKRGIFRLAYTKQLLNEYRRLTREAQQARAPIPRAPSDRRARTDAGRETDARDAFPARPL
jgi:hypothetical protein